MSHIFPPIILSKDLHFIFLVKSLIFFLKENVVLCFIGRQEASIHIPTMLWLLDFNVMENGCTRVLKMAQLRFGI